MIPKKTGVGKRSFPTPVFSAHFMEWYERTFEEEVQRAGERLDPFRAGLLFAREIAYPDLDPAEAEAVLESFASVARQAAAAEADLHGKVAALNEYFFDRLGFGGDREDYYDPENSYLNRVLASRRGIPISLSVIYVEVARRAGVTAAGIGLPGHFIVAAGDDSPGAPIYLDPYNGGSPLTVEDCQRLVRESTGHQGPLDPAWLRPAPPRAIVGRMLNNLRGIYTQREQWPESAAVIKRLAALEPEAAEHIRDLGLIHYRDGQLRSSLALLEEYLARRPEAPDFEQVRGTALLLGGHLSRLN